MRVRYARHREYPQPPPPSKNNTTTTISMVSIYFLFSWPSRDLPYRCNARRLVDSDLFRSGQIASKCETVRNGTDLRLLGE